MQKLDYIIISESGCDINNNIVGDMPFIRVPITLCMNNKNYVDDGTLDLDNFLNAMTQSDETPKTSAPAPALYMQHFEKADKVFIITISGKVSATYNNALLAKRLYQENHPNKFIAVIDSKSASVGETLVARHLHNLLQSGMKATTAVTRTREYVEKMNTLFVINNLSNLKKSGRISHIAGIMASVLRIKPLLAGDAEGNIIMEEKIRGYSRALRRMLKKIGERIENRAEDRVIAVAYCKASDKAKQFLEEAVKTYNFKEAFLVEMNPTISVFANLGGILVTF